MGVPTSSKFFIFLFFWGFSNSALLSVASRPSQTRFKAVSRPFCVSADNLVIRGRCEAVAGLKTGCSVFDYFGGWIGVFSGVSALMRVDLFILFFFLSEADHLFFALFLSFLYLFLFFKRGCGGKLSFLSFFFSVFFHFFYLVFQGWYFACFLAFCMIFSIWDVVFPGDK